MGLLSNTVQSAIRWMLVLQTCVCLFLVVLCVLQTSPQEGGPFLLNLPACHDRLIRPQDVTSATQSAGLCPLGLC